MPESTITRRYLPQLELKYGCNPHQKPAGIYASAGEELPFKVINGKPGYINLLDAVNAWQLVVELAESTGLPAAASFKHVSPAGAAIATPLSADLREIYEVGDKELSPLATAYIRARGADPMCSFGDFAALSGVVDEATARVLKTEVSDGIIAPGYSPEALEILKAKKGGGFIILQANADFSPPEVEYREIYGVVFAQQRNAEIFTHKHLENRVTEDKNLSEQALRDLIVASIAVKYTQSNSVGYALDGQMIGVGAGQQSRVDCVKLAGKKVETWYLRHHPLVRALPFKQEVKRVARTNARVRYIEGDFAPNEFQEWSKLFSTTPPLLGEAEKKAWMETLSDVALSSDAFFPFRDSIDQAAKRGVKYIAQAGGSVADEEVVAAANEYSMVMAFSNLRLFHH